MGLWVAQFIALFRKNLLLKKRNTRMTLMEIIYPLYWLLILLLMERGLPTDTAIPEITSFPAIPLVPFSTKCSLSGDTLIRKCQIAYAPDNSELVTSIMNRISDRLTVLLPFSTNEQIEEYYINHPGELWAAIIWDSTNQTQNNQERYKSKSSFISKSLQLDESAYTIRMNQSQLYTNSNSELISSGFISLQNSIQEAIINEKLSRQGVNKTITMQTSTQSFPQAYEDLANRIYDVLWAIMFPMIFSYVLQGLISSIVTEKKEKLKEGMKMMGLKESVYWSSWLFIQSIINLLLTSLFLLCAYPLGLFVYSPIWFSFSGFFLYSTSIVAMGFLISVFFNNPKTASSVGWMIFFTQVILSGMAQYFLFHKTETWAVCLIYLGSTLLPPLPLTQIAVYMSETEFSHGGLTLFSASPSFYPVWLCLVFLIVNIALYSLAAWYWSNILPGEYGTGKNPWFLFTLSYWRPQTTKKENEEEILMSDMGEDSTAEIVLQDLSKAYGKSWLPCKKEIVQAVDNLSFSIRKGEVFALLGHNGAGKSTTIGMLTGLFPPSSGDAVIQGFSVTNNMDDIRRILGVCPQHDILFPLLNAVEHLELYAALKGVSISQVTSQVDEILQEVGLDITEHGNKPTKEFSGGMKRKLSVAIALIGESQVVFLDECTAGMDPLSRRKIWDLLEAKKQNRTIILTTHFMEEADILGDRIAIMSKGKLRVLGSSVELKNLFGVGYHFVFVKENDCDSEKIIEFVGKHFGGEEQLMEDDRSEISFQIPNSCTPLFSNFFVELDENIAHFQVHSYGIYTTTLEEVFLRIAEEEENE